MKLDFTTTSNVVARPAGDQISNTNTAPAFHVDLTNTTSTLYSTDVFSTNAVVAGVYYYPNGVVLIGGTAAIPANLNVQSLTVGSNVIRLNSAIALFNNAVRIANTANINVLLINTNSMVLQNTGATFNTIVNVANTLSATTMNATTLQVNTNAAVINATRATVNVLSTFNAAMNATSINASSFTVDTNNIVLSSTNARFNVGVNVTATLNASALSVNTNTIVLNTSNATFNVPIVVGSTIAYANGQAIGSGGGGSSNISGNIVVDYLYVNPANTIKLDTTEARFNVTIQANTLINANSVTVNTANIVLLRNRAQFNVAMNVADWFAVNANSIALNTTEARFNVPVVIGSTILYANGASVGGAGGGNGVSLLSQLNDVNISSPSDGQVLTYDSLTSKWRNENATGGSGSGYPPQLGYAGI